RAAAASRSCLRQPAATRSPRSRLSSPSATTPTWSSAAARAIRVASRATTSPERSTPWSWGASVRGSSGLRRYWWSWGHLPQGLNGLDAGIGVGLQPNGQGLAVVRHGLDGHLDGTGVGLGPEVVGPLDGPAPVPVL